MTQAIKLAIGLAALLAAAALLLAHLILGGFTCGTDTSTCAETTEKDGFYAGVLLDPMTAKPYRANEFQVSFGSREGADLPAISFHATDEGHYCVVWANERAIPSVTSAGGKPLEQGDPRTGAGSPGLGIWHGGPAPPDCERTSAGIPWNRARDFDSKWQFWLPIGLALAGGALVAVSLRLAVSLRARRVRPAPYALVAGVVATAVAWALFLLLWVF